MNILFSNVEEFRPLILKLYKETDISDIINAILNQVYLNQHDTRNLNELMSLICHFIKIDNHFREKIAKYLTVIVSQIGCFIKNIELMIYKWDFLSKQDMDIMIQMVENAKQKLIVEYNIKHNIYIKQNY